ncbi:DUF1642 domain-containing protein [Bacillus sp. JJ1503]|uniref:DUF1642 domain-containing protein n=1 Tax=Bacillus sp. JJ1503 TaxID=3122956 RepID=UPI002FFE098B
MTKVTLPREVAEAIENMRERGRSNGAIIATAMTNGSGAGVGWTLATYVLEHEGNSDKLMTALLNGYEIEKSPDEKVREYYDELSDSNVSVYSENHHRNNRERAGIRKTLDLLGIQIEGINA